MMNEIFQYWCYQEDNKYPGRLPDDFSPPRTMSRDKDGEDMEYSPAHLYGGSRW